MISLRNFNKLYENPNLIPVKEGNPYSNQAVDISSRVNVIRLVDAEISNSERRFYVPGTSYLLKTGELANLVKTRKEIFHGTFGSFVPHLTDLLINNPEEEPIPLLNILAVKLRMSVSPSLSPYETELILKWMGSQDFLYLRNFARIHRRESGKIDLNSLVLLEDVDTFKPISNYECDGVQTSEESIGLVKLPAIVKAWEAEFTFQSRDCAKITDGDGRVGKYKDGILTLQEPQFFIRAVNPQLDLKKTLQKKFMDLFSWCGYGVLVGLGGWVSFTLLGQKEGWIPYGISTTLGAIAGGVKAILRPYVYKKDKDSSMDLAFFGVVKDMRFDNLEGLLQKKEQQKPF